ncbi:MAG: hypothetical protein OEZ48_01510 [Candidatus Bathyarchaeota archaeon]|nr:hypothetical protein [Candidatus Bathyarchaeota archaeon]
MKRIVAGGRFLRHHCLHWSPDNGGKWYTVNYARVEPEPTDNAVFMQLYRMVMGEVLNGEERRVGARYDRRSRVLTIHEINGIRAN